MAIYKGTSIAGGAGGGGGNFSGDFAVQSGGDPSYPSRFFISNGKVWATFGFDAKLTSHTTKQIPVDSSYLSVLFTDIVVTPTILLALGDDGNVYSYSVSNTANALGMGYVTTVSQKYLAPIPYFITNGVSVTKIFSTKDTSGSGYGSVNFDTFFALDTDGVLYSWGGGSNGIIGNGTSSGNQITPVEISIPGSDPISHLELSGTKAAHALALSTTGNLYVWGTGVWGALGNGGTSQVNSPTLATSFSGNVVKVVASGGSNLSSGSTSYGNSAVLTSTGDLYVSGTQRDTFGLGSAQINSWTLAATGVSDFDYSQPTTGFCFYVGVDGNLYSAGDNTDRSLASGDTLDNLSFTNEASYSFLDGNVVKVVVQKSYLYTMVWVIDSLGKVYGAGYGGSTFTAGYPSDSLALTFEELGVGFPVGDVISAGGVSYFVGQDTSQMAYADGVNVYTVGQTDGVDK